MKQLTKEEFNEKFGEGKVCELCKNYDLDENLCLKKHKPHLYILEMGPNPECHGIKDCKDFEYFPTKFPKLDCLLGSSTP